jgi:hypothetical protein
LVVIVVGIYVIRLGTNDTFDFCPLERKQGDSRGRDVMLCLKICIKKLVILKILSKKHASLN